MKLLLPLLCVLGAVSSVVGAEKRATPATALTDEDRAKLTFFENEVRPLLAKRCFECHGEKKQKAGLRLDHIDDILKGGDTGPALVRGKPDESLLVTAIRYKDEDLQMPPKEELEGAARRAGVYGGGPELLVFPAAREGDAAGAPGKQMGEQRH
ncbi:MAG: hypothetical protein NTV51_08185 [Verrucomicrobia bacterium]|nr:hypothetical protein [Verrucomicrobiota bacterium]